MSRSAALRTLSREEARAFYDRFGSRQDRQGFYEDVAIDALCARGDFAGAGAVLELGCGTGKLAKRLLERELGPEARYLGLDLSTTMVALARARTQPFGDRAEIRHSEGAPAIEVADASFDRFVSCYVLDLLSLADIAALLREAHRILNPGGLLCTASLTRGSSPVTRVVSRAWAWIQARRPQLVGGCRPIRVAELLPAEAWSLESVQVVSAFGVPSEVVIAQRRPGPLTP